MSGADVLAVKQALSRLSALLGAVSPATTQKQAPAPSPPAASSLDVNAYLTKLTASLEALTSTVREQQQRLGRVEKQFGLPNSAAPAEHVSKATTEEVGWPLDLNRPMGREHVDKAVSFHDL